jgi:hypothetical protein
MGYSEELNGGTYPLWGLGVGATAPKRWVKLIRMGVRMNGVHGYIR